MVSTGRLLKTDSIWVDSRDDALRFADSATALNYCVSHGLEGVRFLVTSGDPKTDVYLDLFSAEKRWLATQSQMG